MLLKQGEADKIAVDDWILEGNLGNQELSGRAIVKSLARIGYL